jgi:hypothetical protein
MDVEQRWSGLTKPASDRRVELICVVDDGPGATFSFSIPRRPDSVKGARSQPERTSPIAKAFDAGDHYGEESPAAEARLAAGDIRARAGRSGVDDRPRNLYGGIAAQPRRRSLGPPLKRVVTSSIAHHRACGTGRALTARGCRQRPSDERGSPPQKSGRRPPRVAAGAEQPPSPAVLTKREETARADFASIPA